MSNIINTTDLYIDDPTVATSNGISVLEEHGFRGIGLHTNRFEEKRENDGNKYIALVDIPGGYSSLDVRNFGIISAKEKGFSEVEIPCPINYLAQFQIKKINEDLKSISKISQEFDINVRYGLDGMVINYLTDESLQKLSKDPQSFLVTQLKTS